MNCLICEDELDEVHVYQGTHPTCEPLDADPLADEIRAELTRIIKWADANSARSLQSALGPSEIGTPCDRRLAYRLAGWPEINHNRDPWPAIVGTSIHHWLEAAVKRRIDLHEPGDSFFETEAELQIDPVLIGHSDLLRDTTVIDYKTAGTDVMREVRKHGPSRAYKIQTQLYGLGQQKAGRHVTHVALVYLPRAGWLSGMHVWTDRYRPHIAHRALERMYSVANGLSSVDIWHHPEVFDLIPAAEDHCGFCPFYRKDGLMNIGTADETGCPGK